MKRLEGKTAIVTGASRGIGLAIARTLGNEGAAVVMCSRDAGTIRSAAQALAEEGINSTAVVCDVRNQDDVLRLLDETLRRLQKIDILVNNAGIGYFKYLADLPVEEFDEMWSTNVRGVFLCTKAVLPSMIAARTGDIVTIASLAGKNSFKGGGGYAATKWALRGMMGSLMLEVREANIRVVNIFPGSVDTAFSARSARGDSITQADDVADAVLFSVTAPRRTMFSELDIRPTIPK
jgi:NADP-dependent 3-hydroxy acid dehydrogenase YdfG